MRGKKQGSPPPDAGETPTGEWPARAMRGYRIQATLALVQKPHDGVHCPLVCETRDSSEHHQQLDLQHGVQLSVARSAGAHVGNDQQPELTTWATSHKGLLCCACLVPRAPEVLRFQFPTGVTARVKT